MIALVFIIRPQGLITVRRAERVVMATQAYAVENEPRWFRYGRAVFGGLALSAIFDWALACSTRWAKGEPRASCGEPIVH
ncbi:MAG UNVERIFIED_CONTAM: hypothetical protein LVT10_18885 [Anaerolineae bacterium]